jgi:Type I restriction enzyme R protein N terminus (HSDR_N)
VHRLLVDSVAVEYRRVDGSIAGGQARVIDFDTADNNDWLAINQFTVSEGPHTRRPDVILFRQWPSTRRDRTEEPVGRSLASSSRQYDGT